MVDGNAYLKDSFVEISYFSFFRSPELFEYLVTLVVFFSIELLNGFKKSFGWIVPAILLHNSLSCAQSLQSGFPNGPLTSLPCET